MEQQGSANHDVAQMNWSEFFDYDAATGSIIWKHRPRNHFLTDRAWSSTNSRVAGKKAGANDGAGYLQVGVAGSLYRVHRIVWEMHHGPLPSGSEVDHINGDRSDNRLCNLRLANYSQNKMNMRMHADNRTGFKGIHKNRTGKYCAQIQAYKTKKYIGVFDTAEEAHEAYLKEAKQLHGQFAKA